MYTEGTSNRQNTYTMANPLYKKSKHQPKPIIANYALILLYVYQNNKGGYTKKELVQSALSCVNQGVARWNWTDGAFSGEFAVFNHNLLMEFKADGKGGRKWFWGSRLSEYLKDAFGDMPEVNLDGYPYNDALNYNYDAKAENDQAYKDYKIGQEIFFQ